MSKSIIILENDLEIRTILKAKLEQNGYAVFCPVDSYVALEHVQHKGFDLFILNDQMPLINGKDTLKILEESGHQGPSIMFVSKFQNLQEYTEYKDCVCIHKPFQIDDLIHQVDSLLNT